MLANTNTVAAFLYLHTAEMMPENAPDEWFLQPEPSPVRLNEVEAFMRETESLVERLRQMGNSATEEEYQTLFYDAAKATFNGDKKMIRTYFRWLYLIMFENDNGPRWGVFVIATGVDQFLDRLETRFGELL